jgi:hypothetical protein
MSAAPTVVTESSLKTVGQRLKPSRPDEVCYNVKETGSGTADLR